MAQNRVIPASASAAATTREDSQVSSSLSSPLVRYPTISEEHGALLASSHRVHTQLVQVIVMTAVAGSMVSFLVSASVVQIFGVLERARELGAACPVLVQTTLTTLLLWGSRLAVACAPAAKGSGIPEVKCMLSGWKAEDIVLQPELRGVPPSTFASWMTLAAKAVGISLALGGGLPLGREGPFTHIAVCIGMQLLEMYSQLKSVSSREQVLHAAVGVGMAVTFTTPIAGLIFAMELMMPHVYDNGMKRMSFTAAALGTMVFTLMYHAGEGKLLPLVSSDMPADTDVSDAFALFCLQCASAFLGFLMGCAAAAFVKSHHYMLLLIKALRGKPSSPGDKDKSSLRKDMLLLAALAWVAAVLLLKCGSPLYGMPPGGAMSKFLFNLEAEQSVAFLLSVFAVRWVKCSVSLCMPVPSGCIAPLLMLGGIAGRAYGELVGDALCSALECGTGTSYRSPRHVAAMLAIVGASSFCSAVSGCLSVAIMMYELLPLSKVSVIPLALAQITASWTARQLFQVPSIFDMSLQMAKLRAMPTLNASNESWKTVFSRMRGLSELMFFAVPRKCTSQDLQRAEAEVERIRAAGESAPTVLPIVERLSALSDEHVILEGVVPLSSLDELSQIVKRCELTSSRGVEARMLEGGKVDVLALAGMHGMLKKPLSVNPGRSLRDTYITAQTEHCQERLTFMVEDSGFLVGFLTQEDLLRI